MTRRGFLRSLALAVGSVAVLRAQAVCEVVDGPTKLYNSLPIMCRCDLDNIAYDLAREYAITPAQAMAKMRKALVGPCRPLSVRGR